MEKFGNGHNFEQGESIWNVLLNIFLNKALYSHNLTLVEIFIIDEKIEVTISYIGTKFIYWYKFKVFVGINFYIDTKFEINIVTLR